MEQHIKRVGNGHIVKGNNIADVWVGRGNPKTSEVYGLVCTLRGYRLFFFLFIPSWEQRWPSG